MEGPLRWSTHLFIFIKLRRRWWWGKIISHSLEILLLLWLCLYLGLDGSSIWGKNKMFWLSFQMNSYHSTSLQPHHSFSSHLFIHSSAKMKYLFSLFLIFTHFSADVSISLEELFHYFNLIFICFNLNLNFGVASSVGDGVSVSCKLGWGVLRILSCNFVRATQRNTICDGMGEGCNVQIFNFSDYEIHEA